MGFRSKLDQFLTLRFFLRIQKARSEYLRSHREFEANKEECNGKKTAIID